MRQILQFVLSIFVFVVANFALTASTTSAADSIADQLYFTKLYVQIGTNLGSHVKRQILQHLHRVETLSVYNYDDAAVIPPHVATAQGHNVLILALGNSTLSLQHIPQNELDSLPYESFRMFANIFYPSNNNTSNSSVSVKNVSILASNGRPLDAHTHTNVSFNKDRVHYGAVVGAYAALETLGFGFLHPLEPFTPSFIGINLDGNSCKGINSNGKWNDSSNKRTDGMPMGQAHPNDDINDVSIRERVRDILGGEFCVINVTESPYWPERSFHIHTQHPLELTEVLQGHDIPQFGPHSPHCSSFRPRRRQARTTSSSSSPSTSPSSSSSSTSSNSASSSTSSHSVDQHNQPIPSTSTPHRSPPPGVAYCERWEDMAADVNLLFEWAVANRLNKLEWLLLGNYKWGNELDTRLRRLKLLTDLGHKFSLYIGADTPLGNMQQHAWSIVNTRLPFREQVQQIHQRVDWVFSAGFDFLTTESGLSEFTHPECELMLDLMNEFADYINGTWGREAGIKVHCSTGQKCDGFPDPRTGEPVNFNFLPTFASPSMGVFPHTVQIYALDDPTAGAYGNQNFSYIEDYLVFEAKRGQRSVMYYGETAYWVNVDVDVPLFLPIYAQRRLHDLRRIAGREKAEGFRIQGQMNFDSGWEWGYWLSDVVTARASWNPILSPLAGTGKTTGYNERDDQWEAFATSLLPLTTLMGPKLGSRMNDILVSLAKAQADMLLFGKVNGKPSHNLHKLSGIAYLSGDDTWVDLPRKLGLHFLQPDKVHFKEHSDPDWKHVLPLLREMENTFSAIADAASDVLKDAEEEHVTWTRQRDTASQNTQNTHNAQNAQNTHNAQNNVDQGQNMNLNLWHPNNALLEIMRELDDCMRLLALRATHVRMLYESRDSVLSPTPAHRNALQRQSRGIISAAAVIVSRREAAYRVPWQRIASWRENPTVYRYGYLWSVHSLYYWWRDQGKAEEGSLQSEYSPCYLNRMDISEISVGWGKYSLEVLRNAINRYSPYKLDLVNCFAPPSHEYIFPRDLVPVFGD